MSAACDSQGAMITVEWAEQELMGIGRRPQCGQSNVKHVKQAAFPVASPHTMCRISDPLLSMKEHIDYWTVLDANSTDKTTAVVKQLMAGRPGHLLHHDFIDFSTARNAALKVSAEEGNLTSSCRVSSLNRLLLGVSSIHLNRKTEGFSLHLLSAERIETASNQFSCAMVVHDTCNDDTI